MGDAQFYDSCRAKNEIENLKTWQQGQNNHLGHIDECLGDLREAEARRAGAEAMLKWILGFAGFSGLTALVSLILQLAR